MKNVVILNASPKLTKDSSSRFLSELTIEHIDKNFASSTIIDVRDSYKMKKTTQDFATMSKADALIIIFPLYIFCMPGMLTGFLQEYCQYLNNSDNTKTKNVKVYSVINCGFPESSINSEAAKTIEMFAKYINAQFRYAVLIGGGGMLSGMKDKSFMKKTQNKVSKALNRINNDIIGNSSDKTDFINIEMNFPNSLYLFIGNKSWGWMAKKNGLKKKDLYKAPYKMQ